MKKLNRKGFTLIELLAIIVILAIIMVVTFPNILDAISTSRQKTFVNSANSVADWVEDQYAFANLNQGDTTAFQTICTKASGYCKTAAQSKTAIEDFKTFLTAAGVVPANYSKVEISFNGDRACVKLTNNADGDFGNITVGDNPNLAASGEFIVAKSNGCSE